MPQRRNWTIQWRLVRLRLPLTELAADTPMTHEFDIDHLQRILENCPKYEDGHHLGRPFMSAYQIAIRFAEEHPNHDVVRTLPLSGEGTGALSPKSRAAYRPLPVTGDT